MSLVEAKHRVIIDGTELKCSHWSVNTGSFGSIGSVAITTNRKRLKAAGIKLIGLRELDRPIPIDVHVELPGQPSYQIFGGSYDYNTIDWTAEEVTIAGRDWSKTMLESESGLGANASDIKRVVTDLAKIHGLNPIVTDPPVQIGVKLNETQTLNMSNQSHWNMLWKLALKCGFEVRVTPHKDLYFGPPPEITSKRELIWKPPTAMVDATPLLSLNTKNNVHESKTFSVQVISYDHGKNQVTRGQAVVLGSDQINNSGSAFYKNGKIVASISNKFIKSGTYWAAAGSGVAATLATELQSHPTYRFYSSGLSPEEANALALNFAKQIAKREFIIQGAFRIAPSFQAHDRILLDAYDHDGVTKDDLEGYGGKEYTVVQVNHRWDMPQGSGPSTQGYATQFNAVAIPPGISDNVAGAFQSWF